ncbi:hypothetical protein HY950_01015, partial [Candidatus Gottesmanbacteria bacterium]|nr:hypothetical protein [Candidatus Gottesmanbacteria bacterium]
GVSLGIGLQLHYLFLFLFPVAALWLLLSDTTGLRLRSWFATAVGFLLGYASFLLFELRHGFPNTRSIVQFIGAGKDTGFSAASYQVTVSDVIYRSVARLVLRLPQPEALVSIAGWQRSLWEWGAGTVVAVGIMILVYQAAGGMWQKGARLLLLWGGIVAALFGLYRRAIYDYYFGIWFALPFFLTALVLYHIKKIRFIGGALAAAVAAFLLWWNWQGRPFIYAPNNQLAQAKAIAREALDNTDGKPFNFALVTQGNSDHAYRYFFELWGNPPVTIEPEFADPERKTVKDQLIVICEEPECKPLGHPLWEIAGFGTATISGTWQTSFVTIHKLVHL